MRFQIRRFLVGAAALATVGTLGAGLVGAGPVTPSPSSGQASPTATDTPRSVIGGRALASPGVIANTAAGVPAPPQVAAGGWLVADLDTGDVLAAQDAHGRYAPASTLKVLTALVMAPQLDPSNVLTATSEAVAVAGSKVGVVPGHGYTVAMLFTGLFVVSGNDATRVLASKLGGDDVVIAQMNAEAHKLQADDTHAGTVTGLDAPGQTTSAYDLALIGRAALERPDLASYAAINRTQFAGADVPGFAITNHNLLLGRYPGTYGLKNGFTEAARASYIGAVERGGHHLMVTLLRTDPAYRNAAEALFNWGFAADGKVRPVGTLVRPLAAGAPAAATASHVANPVGTRTGGPDRESGGLSGVEYGAIGAGAAVVLVIGLRRRQLRRRRLRRYGGRHGGRKLTLPKI